MTENRISELLAYYEASRNVLETTKKNYPEKLNKTATDMAMRLFDDTISVIKYIQSVPENYSKIEQSVSEKDTPVENNSSEN
jgi:hypothetical protein